MKVARKKNKSQATKGGIIVFSVVVAFLFGYYVWQQQAQFEAGGELSGVLLESGDIYFGKLTRFPRLTLHDAYTLQAVVDPDDPTQPAYQVVPIAATIWAPDKIFLNYDKIVFIGGVGEDSQIMQIINQQQNQ